MCDAPSICFTAQVCSDSATRCIPSPKLVVRGLQRTREVSVKHDATLDDHTVFGIPSYKVGYVTKLVIPDGEGRARKPAMGEEDLLEVAAEELTECSRLS